MNDNSSASLFENELQRLYDASRNGNMDIELSDTGLTENDARRIRMLNEITKNFKATLEYDLMKYKLTGDALAVGLWDMDIVTDDPGNRNSRLVWSQEVRNMLGFTDENDFPNLLSSLTDRIHPEDRDKAVGAFSAHVGDRTGKTAFNEEYRLMMKDGSYRHFLAFGTTLRKSDGTPLRVAGAIKDIEDEKKLEQSLKEAEEEKIALHNLANIMDSLNAMICVTTTDSDDILFMNEGMRKVFGLESDGTGRKCYEVIHGLDKRCSHCPCPILDKNPDTEVIWEQSNELTGRTYRAYSRFINWPGGKTAHIQNAIDITDIKKAQEDLENQNLRLNLLVGGMNVGLWDRYVDRSLAYDDSHSQIWWSDEFRRLLGYTDENDFPNEVGSWLDSVHPDDLDKTVKAMTDFLNDKTGTVQYNVENRMKLKNGTYRWFRSFGSAIRDEHGNPIRTAGATEDITARKEAEREIAERGELNRILFDNAPVGLTLYDENFKFIDCNENILKMYGVTREYYSEFFGSRAHSPEYQPDGQKSADKAMDLVKRTVVNGETIKVEWVHNTPDGQPFPVEMSMMRLKLADRYVGLAYIYDMREQTRLKEEIRVALDRAEKANKAKSDFLAKMSHEIRTPMNAIMGITEIKLSSGSLSEDMEESLGKIYDSGNLLMGIINDILDLSKIEADKLEILPVKYDISSLLNDTVQLNRLRYDSKPIEFTILLDEKTPHNLFGDELRIKQILNNLLSNAYKYTDRGGIELEISAEPPLSADGTPPGGAGRDDITLIFSVSDTGQGLTQEQQDLLFTEYMRFNQEANRTTMGTGLGLSITKSLVDLMGGKISVSSTAGEGSTFTVRIPQKRVGTAVCGPDMVKKIMNAGAQSAAIAKRSQFVREFMPYGSVLVVDDVDSNIYVTKGMLMPYGLKIDTASSGFEAIEKVKSGNVYDIIFMDHMMPKMDGIEATKIIRDEGYPGTIVALTANAIVGQSEVFLGSGFDGYISKPIDTRELNVILNDFIRNRKPPEVIEAARKTQLENVSGKRKSSAKSTANMRVLRKHVISDVRKAIEVLGSMNNIRSLDKESTDLFVVTVHGIKSSLASINENTLSKTAYRLELAGKENNIDVMAGETPGFIEALRKLISEMPAEVASARKPARGQAAGSRKATDGGKTVPSAQELLGKFISACGSYDANAARKTLDALYGCALDSAAAAALDEIGTYVLHSDFEAAAERAGNLRL